MHIEKGFTDRLVEFLKKVIPSGLVPRVVFDWYHLALAFLGHLVYGFPSRTLMVFGVTGTKGKTTTSFFLTQLLEKAGYRVALSSTVYFQIGEKRWKNETKMGLPGRFFVPRFLRQAVRNGCQVAVIETGSEAILQHRHRFVHYDFAVFTNLAPEHIERHGGFENYKKTKMKLFEGLGKQKIKKTPSFVPTVAVGTSAGRQNQKNNTVPTAIVNLASIHAKDFLNAAGKARKIGVKILFDTQNPSSRAAFSFGERTASGAERSHPPSVGMTDKVFCFRAGTKQVCFGDHSYPFVLPGRFNIENALLAASATAMFIGTLSQALEQLPTLELPEGRVEIVERAGVTAVIDYAHEPYSLERILEWARETFPQQPIIHVFGSQGGGRDTWKRTAMGAVSARFSDEIVLTNEDPYQDPPEKIIDDIAAGIESMVPVKKMIDRRAAIRYALRVCRARNGVLVVTGKGSETVMCIGTAMVPWSDRRVILEELGEKQ